MNKKSFISLFALIVLVGGFYPAYGYFCGKVFSRGKTESQKVTESFVGDRYFHPDEGRLKIALRSALEQAPSVAGARNMPIETVERIILAHIEFPTLSLIGKKTVDTAEINRALDQIN